MIVVDTSALAKLLIEEAESAALRRWLETEAAAGTDFAVSTIATTELRRLAIRVEVDAAAAEHIAGAFRILRLTDGILHLAARLPARHLGTLDAIHIASALSVGASHLITYDLRQADAARAEGLGVLTPGR